jgi:hypothetical protein
MLEREAMSPAVHVVVALACALAAGCACVRHTQTEPVPTAPPAASIPVAVTPIGTTPEVEPTRAVVEAPRAPTKPAPAVRASIPKAPITVAPVTTVAPPKPPPPEAAAVTAKAPASAPQGMPKAAAVSSAPQLAPAPLDFKSLATRLRQTNAIGVLTTATLAELRRDYDMLLLKVLSLLQDSDPSLARDIVKSRAAIWSILEDPRKFTESNLMAGVTT